MPCPVYDGFRLAVMPAGPVPVLAPSFASKYAMMACHDEVKGTHSSITCHCAGADCTSALAEALWQYIPTGRSPDGVLDI